MHLRLTASLRLLGIFAVFWLKSLSPFLLWESRLGGLDAQVSYAGPQNDFVGLDQINLRIPRELAGRGDVLVNLRADGIAANTALVNIK